MNLISTCGSMILALGFVVLAFNIFKTLWKGKMAGPNPWNAFTLEWATTSPPPDYNFAVIPEVRSRRPLWDIQHPEAPDWIHEDNITVPAGVAPSTVAPPVVARGAESFTPPQHTDAVLHQFRVHLLRAP